VTWPVNYTTPFADSYTQLVVRNTGGQTLYFGSASVTPASGLAVRAGETVVIPFAPSVGNTICVTTDGQLTLPKPKPTARELITDAKAAALKLGKSHAREMALNALAQAGLWLEEAGK
jgi:hypothetical protein